MFSIWELHQDITEINSNRRQMKWAFNKMISDAELEVSGRNYYSTAPLPFIIAFKR